MNIVNMLVLKKSRKPLKAGDVFVFKMPATPFFFGRVIRTDALIGPIRDNTLIYLYRASSPDKTKVPELSKNELLVPPIMTNRQAWLKGYFENVANRPLKPEELLESHCFFDDIWGRFYDDQNNELPGRIEPCGEYGLHSYRTIDDAVSKALGVKGSTERVHRP